MSYRGRLMTALALLALLLAGTAALDVIAHRRRVELPDYSDPRVASRGARVVETETGAGALSPPDGSGSRRGSPALASAATSSGIPPRGRGEQTTHK